MSASKLQILDFILETENEIELKYKSLLETEVTKIVGDKYGKEGVDIVNTYYHGDDENPVEEECDDCAEKAKKMIDSINYASEIVESINSVSVENLFSKIEDSKIISEKLQELSDYIKGSLTEDKVNDTLLRNLLIKIILSNNKMNSNNDTNKTEQ